MRECMHAYVSMYGYMYITILDYYVYEDTKERYRRNEFSSTDVASAYNILLCQ